MRTVLIGLGQVGVGYDVGAGETQVYTHARAIAVHPAFELAGAVDSQPEARERFQSIYGSPVFAGVADARAVAPEVVIVAAPTRHHLTTVREVLDTWTPRAILCEKPLAYALEDAREIVRICAERRVPLFVNYMRRSEPGAREVARRMRTGEIAAPVKGVAWYSKGLLHNGSHFFNLLEHWLGPMVAADMVSEGRRWDGIDPEPDVMVRFERGDIMFMAAREEHYSHYTVELVAPNGRLRYDGGGDRISWAPAGADPAIAGYTVLLDPDTIASELYRCQWHVADQLAAALTGHPAFLCDGADALATLESLHRVINTHAHANH